MKAIKRKSVKKEVEEVHEVDNSNENSENEEKTESENEEEDIRERGKNALKCVIKKQQNINVIEESIFDLVDENLEKEEFDKIYCDIVYQVVNDIISGKKLNDVLESIEENKICWKHECFSEMIKNEEEQDDFIKHPFTVVEGIAECNKCGSKRVYSTTKQTRSGDESSTTFNTCLQCKSTWSYSG